MFELVKAPEMAWFPARREAGCCPEQREVLFDYLTRATAGYQAAAEDLRRTD
ncbi:hypothetical protein AB4305_19400 [Nocardia sp. 2YAB30]|uniref:hypothetical protein n=1 Tax=unclassified Nocardia TaxID=2637762 RepID=UPI003F9A9BA3